MMRHFHQRNLLADKVSLASGNKAVTGMATEGAGGQMVKELVKIIGLSILGAGVGWMIGTILNKIFYGKSSTTRISIKFDKIREGIWGKEHHIDREKLVGEMEKRNSPIFYLLQDCINEGDLWASAVKLIDPVANWKGDPIDLTVEIDKLYVGRDDKTFVNKAKQLADGAISDAWNSQAQLVSLGKALKSAGGSFEDPILYRSMTVEQLDKAAEGIVSLLAAWQEVGGAASDISRLSRKGQFKLAQFIGTAGEQIKANDKKIAEAEKNLIAIKRFNTDETEVKAFLKSTPEIEEANNRLMAATKVMGAIDKVRLEITSTVLKVVEAILNVLNGLPGGLDSATTKIGTEALFDEAALLAKFPELAEGTMALESLFGDSYSNGINYDDQLLRENSVVIETLLSIGTLCIRESGVQAELGGDIAHKFNDSDVVALLAARIANRKRL